MTDDFDALQEKEDDPIQVKTTGYEEAVHLVEDEEYDKVEYVEQNDNETPEDTVKSSMESNCGAIWQAELINDITPEEEEEDHAEKSGEEDKTEIQVQLNSNDVVVNNESVQELKTTHDEGTEKSLSLEKNEEMNDEIVRWSKFWVRILSLLIMLFFLLFSPVSGKATSAVLSLFSEDQGTVIKH